MNVLVLDGSKNGDQMAERIHQALASEFHLHGWEAETIVLREQKIGNCAGDFFCWIRTPGMCNIADDNRRIAAATMHSDLIIYLSPITYGGYSSVLKRALDHQIQNISPFFAQIEGEIHHQPRYKHNPKMLAIGWIDQHDSAQEAIFQHLVQRNAINMHAPAQISGVVTTGESDDLLQINLRNWLRDIEQGHSTPLMDLPKSQSMSFGKGKIHRTVLLVGSPRGKKSTSQSLGDYLLAQLAASGVETESIHIYPALSSLPKMQNLLQSVQDADLVVLAFPLYVDSLPGPVVQLLDRIAEQRGTTHAPQGLMAIANCGFPEADHIQNALALCAEFANQAGFCWTGGLALGEGEGLVHGMPLNELGGRAIPIKHALELAAASLVNGGPIPSEAIHQMAKPVIPTLVYRFMGGWGWKQQARRYSAQKRLRNRPYQEAGR